MNREVGVEATITQVFDSEPDSASSLDFRFQHEECIFLCVFIVNSEREQLPRLLLILFHSNSSFEYPLLNLSKTFPISYNAQMVLVLPAFPNLTRL